MKPRFDNGRPCLEADHSGRAQEVVYFGKMERVLSVAAILAARANRGRTQRARELRHAAMQFLISPMDTQDATARRLGITPRRFRQLIREMRDLMVSEIS